MQGIIEWSQKIDKAIVGSSNLTAGGLFLNYEANVSVTLDNSEKSEDFRKQVEGYWEGLLNDVNTQKCDSVFLNKLLENSAVADETNHKPFKNYIEEISDLPFKARKSVKIPSPTDVRVVTTIPIKFRLNFVMTLSSFDVSDRSQDPIILIPIAALKSMPIFWNWPKFYTYSKGGYPQLYATADILIDGEIIKNWYIRIYYYGRKKEFRLQCEHIKRKGRPGDIIRIYHNLSNPLYFKIELIRKNTVKYNRILPFLTEKASKEKIFRYFTNP